eukprot:2209785-Pleurochrysis_carterae.AAC.1
MRRYHTRDKQSDSDATAARGAQRASQKPSITSSSSEMISTGSSSLASSSSSSSTSSMMLPACKSARRSNQLVVRKQRATGTEHGLRS